MSLNTEQQKMVVDNEDLITLFIKIHKLNYEEYYDILAIALCRSAETYDARKSTSFRTYASSSLERAIAKEHRNKSRAKRTKYTTVSYEKSNIKDNTHNPDRMAMLGIFDKM